MNSDPSSAIGSSKELVETICKLILDDYDCVYRSGDGLLDLFRLVQQELNLTVEAVPESAKGSKATATGASW